MTFYDRFTRLNNTSDRSEDLAVASTHLNGYLVGRDSDGHAILLIRTGEEVKRRRTYKLANVEAATAVDMRVSLGGVVEEARFAVIRHSGDLNSDRRYFFAICEALAQLMGTQPSSHVLKEGIERLLRLFEAKRRPATSSLAGLAGELVFILGSADPARSVRSWRPRKSSRLDFLFSEFAVEVKTATGRRRQHHLSKEQLDRPSVRPTYLVSVLLEQSSDGTSGEDLIDRVEKEVDANGFDYLQLREKVVDSLGDQYENFLAFKFDLADAINSLMVYSSESVPAIRGPLSLGVDQVSFRSDFEVVHPVDEAVSSQILFVQ